MNTPYLTTEYLLLQIADVTDEIFFAFQPESNQVLYLNPAFYKVWNLPAKAIGTDFNNLMDTIHPDDQISVNLALHRLQKEDINQTFEFRILCSEQKEKWIKAKAYLFRGEEKAIIMGTATDVTEEKEQDNRIQKTFDKKNAILDILSHDLAVPFAKISTTASVLLECVKPYQDDSLLELLEIITENSKSGIVLINNFLNKELKEVNINNINKQQTDIVERINDVITQYQRSHHLINIEFRLISELKSMYINIDAVMIMQIMNNLLSNALKFTHENGNITVEIKDKDEAVLISVKDDGIGIPAALQPYLFDKFTRAKRQGINGEPTIGLGMFNIKNMVEWHNGKIWFHSIENKGSTFYIELPKNG